MEAGGVNITMDPPYRSLGRDENGVVTIVYDNPIGKVSGIASPGGSRTTGPLPWFESVLSPSSR